MHQCSVAFSTSTKPSFSWVDGFDDVGIDELHQLHIICRYATASLQAEISRRTAPRPEESQQWLESLQQNVESLGPLCAKEKAKVKTAFSTEDGTERNALEFREFVWLIRTAVCMRAAVVVAIFESPSSLGSVGFPKRATFIQGLKRIEGKLSSESIIAEASKLEGITSKKIISWCNSDG